MTITNNTIHCSSTRTTDGKSYPFCGGCTTATTINITSKTS